MEGYRTQVNRLMDLAAYFTAQLKATEGFELVIDPVICFFLQSRDSIYGPISLHLKILLQLVMLFL